MKAIDKAVRRKIERYMYLYPTLPDIITNSMALGDVSDKPLVSSRSRYRKSDPTPTSALRLLENSERIKWYEVVHKVVSKFQEESYGRFIQYRYFDLLSEEQSCNALRIERSTYYSWRDDVVAYAALLAVQAGLIKVR